MADRQAPANGFRGEREECLPSDSQEQRVTFALQVRLHSFQTKTLLTT